MAKTNGQFQDFLDSIPNWMRNKYLITFILFLFIVVFVGANCLISQIKMGSEISKLKKQKGFYTQEIEELHTYLYELQNNEVVQEKLAREKYFVKKPNEEVFIMQEVGEK